MNWLEAEVYALEYERRALIARLDPRPATCGVYPPVPEGQAIEDVEPCGRPAVETLVFCNPNISDLPVCAAHFTRERAEMTFGV